MSDDPHTESNSEGWIGVDLDGTLAEYHGWNGGAIGDPIPMMVARVKSWIETGQRVKIFTARVSPWKSYHEHTEQRRLIREWCLKHLGVALEVTCVKDFQMIELWDDRCVTVRMNQGFALTAGRI